MSGGLLAISRRWWNETGGYDSSMLGWGGENIDLSLRIWRCGGAIKAAKGSYVAHMYREPGKLKTAARFRVPKGAPTRNRATSARAHFGRLWAKTVRKAAVPGQRLRTKRSTSHTHTAAGQTINVCALTLSLSHTHIQRTHTHTHTTHAPT